MRYLKSYKIFESEDIDKKSITDDIKNCFLSVSDMIEENSNYGVRVTEFSKKRGKVIRGLNLNDVDFEIMIIPNIKTFKDLSKVDRSDMSRIYRPTSMNSNMISEIENSISLTEGIIGLKLEYAAVEWVNAYNYNEKGENGPGTSSKKFSIDGIIPKSDKIEKGSYNINYLFDFLKRKSDKVRWVKVFFKIPKE